MFLMDKQTDRVTNRHFIRKDPKNLTYVDPTVHIIVNVEAVVSVALQL